MAVLDAYFYSPGRGSNMHLKKRQANLSSEVIEICNRSERRLRVKFNTILAAGKTYNTTKCAVARELVGFLWEAAMVYYKGELKEVG